MSTRNESPETHGAPRRPRVFAPDHPGVIDVPEPEIEVMAASAAEADSERRRAWSATGVLVSAMSALIALSLSVSFAAFVSASLSRSDWVGWTALLLILIAAAAALVILIREIGGMFRLARMTKLKRDIAAALEGKDKRLEGSSVRRLRALYRGRPDLRWSLARLKDHERDVVEPGDLLRLADREVMAGLDREVRRTILASAKRVSVVTAMSPILWLGMVFVLVENVRMLRAIASLYGGRPGLLGALRLGKLVVSHIIATGGLAMTDDLLGQFLGQDLLRRLSRRLGEGAFNGTLTARIGTAAVDVTRPLPFLDSEPIRLRDLVAEVVKRTVSRGKA